MRTLLEVVRLSTTYLSQRGGDSARLDAELIAAHALGIGRIDLYLQHDRPLTEPELAAVRGLIRRRGTGEPTAHLLGRREFFSRSFRVSAAVLIPRPETETLVELALSWARSAAGPGGEGLRLADLGTGSGCIACTLAAELPGATVTASDVSPVALEVAAENARQLGVADRVTLVEGSWGAAFGSESRFHGVVSNPPYVTTAELAELAVEVRDHEPRLALDGGANGLAQYSGCLDAAARLVERSGLVAVEVDPRRAGAVTALMRSALPGREIAVSPDLAGRLRVARTVARPVATG